MNILPLLVEFATAITIFYIVLVAGWSTVGTMVFRQKIKLQSEEKELLTFVKVKTIQVEFELDSILNKTSRAPSFREYFSIIFYGLIIAAMNQIITKNVPVNEFLFILDSIFIAGIPFVAFKQSQTTLQNLHDYVQCIHKYVAVENQRVKLVERMRTAKSIVKATFDDPHLTRYNRYKKLKEAVK